MTQDAATILGHDIPRRAALERHANALAKYYWRFTGKIHPAMTSPLTLGKAAVFLVHNPKCGGTTLKNLLQIEAKRTTHTPARQMFRHTVWTENVFVVAVRNPYDRFISSYLYHVKGPYTGKLVKRHGKQIKSLSAFEYFDFIEQYPENLGLQTNWTDYPSTIKPHCDIILRLEQANDWPIQLRAQGIGVADTHTKALNSTKPVGARDQSQPNQTGLTQPQLTRLRAMIEQKYRTDYLRFNYAFEADL